MRVFSQVLAAALLVWGGAWAARGGDIEGEVHLPAMPVAPERPSMEYPGQESRSAGGAAAGAASPFKDVVIYVQGAREGRGLAPAPVLAQHEKAFEPRVLPIQVGTTVRFPNRDAFFHNVFSYSKIKKFDLGRYPTGQERTITFDAPGLVRVFCEIHSQMKGYILVLDTRAFTVPDDRGHFALRDIPTGQYTVVAWHPTLPEKSFAVDVGKALARLDVRF